MKFPQYRQLAGTQVLYEILSVTHFVEYKKLGSKWLRFEVVASQYPEMLRIREMLAAEAPFEELEESVFLGMIK